MTSLKHFVTLSAIALASACATPEERCVARESRELRTVEALISETNQNLARGYAYVRETRLRPRLTFCAGHRHANVGLSFCRANDIVQTRVPVAIDPEAEHRKLATLEARRRDLLIETQTAIAACRG